MLVFVFDHQIREELRANGIDVYPQKEFDEDAEDRMINGKIRVRAGCQSTIYGRICYSLPSVRPKHAQKAITHIVPSETFLMYLTRLGFFF